MSTSTQTTKRTPIYAGEDAMYTRRSGMPIRVRVEALTAKRVTIVMWSGSTYLVRHVKAERLERIGGGLLEIRGGGDEGNQ